MRDGSGKVLAIYENEVLDELVIYGSSRIGSYNGKTAKGKRTLGNKKYELSNHLGNVLSVISDNKIGIDTDTDLVADYYEPYIVSESDYYPFGMQMANRSFQNEEYLFAFQGQESNEELGTVHYKYREADIITGRFWSVDPLAFEYAYNSPFAFSENRVIDGVELEGREFLGMGWVVQGLADGLAKLEMKRAAGFVETYGHGLFIDPAYITYQKVKNISEDQSAWNVTKQLDPTGITSIPDVVETVEKAVDGDERAQGQVVGMVVVAAGGAKAVKAAKASSYPTKPKTQQFIKNRAPGTQKKVPGSRFVDRQVKVKNGKVVDKDGNPYTSPHEENFIIDMDGNLKVGIGHDFLAGGFRGAKMAGSGKIVNGKFTEVNNQTGHFQTNSTQLNTGVKMLKEIGVANKNTKVVDLSN